MKHSAKIIQLIHIFSNFLSKFDDYQKCCYFISLTMIFTKINNHLFIHSDVVWKTTFLPLNFHSLVFWTVNIQADSHISKSSNHLYWVIAHFSLFWVFQSDWMNLKISDYCSSDENFCENIASPHFETLTRFVAATKTLHIEF